MTWSKLFNRQNGAIKTGHRETLLKMAQLHRTWDQGETESGLAEEAIERGWAVESPDLLASIASDRTAALTAKIELLSLVATLKQSQPNAISDWCDWHDATCVHFREKLGNADGAKNFCLDEIQRQVASIRAGHDFQLRINRYYLPDYDQVMDQLI